MKEVLIRRLSRYIEATTSLAEARSAVIDGGEVHAKVAADVVEDFGL